jgi:hypothetical protein
VKLSDFILVAAFVALPLVLAAQFRWLAAPPAEFRRKRRRLLSFAALLFPMLALAHCEAKRIETPPTEPGMMTTWPEERGTAGPPGPPPPPPPRPVERQEDCPPGTTLAGGLCRADPVIEE